MTKIARKLLARLIAAGGRIECAKTYHPARTLVQNGFAVWTYGTDGKIYLEVTT